MQSTNIPSKIPLPFANSAGSSYKNTIPVASQIGITNGKASLTDGFPPLTFQAISAGGVPPFGADFNGILNEITAIQQWQEAGGFFPYDAAFATTIGGYPKGALIQSANSAGLWLNTVENNSTNPDTGGAGWVPSPAWYGGLGYGVPLTGGSYSLTALEAAVNIITFTGTLTSNQFVIVPNITKPWILVNQTSGAYTVTVKTASGTGVTLTQGQSTYVFGDGNNVYYADSSKVASFNGRVGSVSLNATDVTSALGYIPVNPNQFPNVFSGNGYQQLPSGFIIQWGNIVNSSSTLVTINLSITFPNAAVAGFAADSITGGGSARVSYGVAFPNNSQIQVVGTSAGNTYQWMALGY